MAATASPSATTAPSATPKDQKVEDIKDRVSSIASKAAELQQKQQRAIAGTVKTKTISTLTIDTEKKTYKIELMDEITVVQMLKGKRTELTIDDVAKDDPVVVFGEYDTNLDILKAKLIVIQTPKTLVRVTGKITEVTKADYTITVEGIDGKTYIIDFETATKTSLWAGKDGVQKGGFSKLTPNDIIYVVGTAVAKKENRVSALRITNFFDLSGTIPKPSPTVEATSKPTVKPTIEP